MDFRSRRHERGSNWTDPEIVELLQLWSDESVQIELESSLRNQRVFDRIAQILRKKGIYRTGDQCREKIKKMKLEYRRIKDNHKMRSWKFYDVMDRVLANRPAITYSSLGGAVIAQQVFQSAGCSDPYLQGVPPGAFGPTSSGGFLFGQPPKTGDPLDIKCEDVDDSLLNSGVAPPEMYYGSGDEQETDGQSLLGAEDTLGRGECSTNTRTSPSGCSSTYCHYFNILNRMFKSNRNIYFLFIPAGFSDLNIAGSGLAAAQAADGPLPQDTAGQPSKDGSHPPTSVRQRKRRRGGKTSWGHGGARHGGQGSLDKALANFLNWQQSAEERLLSLEESRLERELQAEERREQWEERRAEQERQHELRLFSMLTGALVAGRQGAAIPATTQADPSVPLPAYLSPVLTNAAAPSVSSSLPQPPSESPTAQVISTQETKSTLPTSVTSCKMSENVLATLRGTETPHQSVYLSKRGNSIRQHQGILQEGYAQYGLDRHHDTDNPDVSLSHSKHCVNFSKKLQHNHKSFIFLF